MEAIPPKVLWKNIESEQRYTEGHPDVFQQKVFPKKKRQPPRPPFSYEKSESYEVEAVPR